MAQAVVTATTQLKPAIAGAVAGTMPVVATDQAALLRSDDPVLAANKRLCYDMYRTVLQAGRADRIGDFIGPDYVQHNPNVVSGPDALAAFIRGSRPERPIAETIALPLVSIVAERDMVMLCFVRKEHGADGADYYTSWFDLFRIAGGRIVEHWDPALKSAEMLKLDPNTRRIDP